MWAEQLDARTIDSRIWPRTAVMAERFWSPQSTRDVTSMYQRLPKVSIELEQAGLTHLTGPPMMRRSLSGQLDPGPLNTLAGVLEPVSFGERYDGQKTDSRTPLDRLVDAVVADPPSRFEIAQDVNAVLNKTADTSEAEARLTQRFMQWWLISPSLEEQMKRNPRLNDAAIRAQQLGRLGVLGLQALARRDPQNQAIGGLLARTGPILAPDRQRSIIDEARKPAALVRFTFLESLQKLVEAQK
jgi:hexosaminidase